MTARRDRLDEYPDCAALLQLQSFSRVLRDARKYDRTADVDLHEHGFVIVFGHFGDGPLQSVADAQRMG